MTAQMTTLQLREDLSIRLRRAVHDDLPRIAEIYSHAVLSTTATFDTELRSDEAWGHWLETHHGDHHPVWVLYLEDRMVGWCSLSPPYRPSAYRFNAEPMVFLAAEAQHKGLGPALLMFLEDEARKLGFHNLICRVCCELEGVIRLLERVGFRRIGIVREAGRKFDRWLDVVSLQKLLE
jgi:phosphinothricin acetyltransferase